RSFTSNLKPGPDRLSGVAVAAGRTSAPACPCYPLNFINTASKFESFGYTGQRRQLSVVEDLIDAKRTSLVHELRALR
ncbi:unnamed protein product, partial [Linum tenue]